jgi:Na+/melibiose symporter-like transporter
MDHCIRFIDPIWLNLYRIANYVIMISYYAIPGAILLLQRKRSELIPSWVAFTFAGFILLCGTTHLMANLVLDHDWYEEQIIFYIATAVLSIVTAVLSWISVRRILDQYKAHKKTIAETAAVLEEARSFAIAQEVIVAVDDALDRLHGLMDENGENSYRGR